MGISPVSHLFTNPMMKKNGGKILGGVAAVVLGTTGGVAFVKSCIKSHPTDNTYKAKQGDMYCFYLPDLNIQTELKLIWIIILI